MIRLIKLLIYVLTIGLLSCTYINETNDVSIKFQDLPKAVQDTLIHITEIDYDYKVGQPAPPDYPEIVAFKGEYRFEEITIGPWIMYYVIRNVDTGEKIDLKYPTPTPIIIYDSIMYIPKDLNFISNGINSSTTFSKYIIKWQ